jgi:hypothetical protein
VAVVAVVAIAYEIRRKAVKACGGEIGHVAVNDGLTRIVFSAARLKAPSPRDYDARKAARGRKPINKALS